MASSRSVLQQFLDILRGSFSPQQRDEKLSSLKEHCAQMVALERKKVGDGCVRLTLSVRPFAKLQFPKSEELRSANHHLVR